MEKGARPDPGLAIADRNSEIEAISMIEAGRLLEWAQSCRHHQKLVRKFPRLAEGSEHIVYFNAREAKVFKLTRPGTYGAYYEERMGRVLEFQCTPRDYLERMELWEVLFGYAPICVGITPRGQIVTRQGFVVGLEPSQESVDDFLEQKSLEAIRKNCWLWRKPAQASESGEVVIGDARLDNFKLTELGKIVPIDIRLWWRELGIDPPSKVTGR